MGLNLQNEALTLPDGTEFPGTPQELLDLIAQYLAITGDENFSGINYGSTEPDADNRDRPWFRLDDEGDPLGWYAWTGASWTAIPIILPSGTARPASPAAYQVFVDTTIGAVLYYTGSAWVTIDGVSGDVKYVKADTLADALDKNPGWSWDADSAGRVIAGASDGTSDGDHTYGTQDGADDVTLEIANLPSDAISLKTGWDVFPGQFQNGPQGAGIYPITTGINTTNTTGPLNGGVTQEPVSIIPKRIFYWVLVKD